MRELSPSPLPAPSPRANRFSGRAWFGDVVFLVFVLTQLIDGSLTYVGLTAYGPAAEANPLIAWSVASFGASSALIGAKMFAVACGAALHLSASHRIVGLLTLVYLGGAIWPWTRVLWP